MLCWYKHLYNYILVCLTAFSAITHGKFMLFVNIRVLWSSAVTAITIKCSGYIIFFSGEYFVFWIANTMEMVIIFFVEFVSFEMPPINQKISWCLVTHHRMWLTIRLLTLFLTEIVVDVILPLSLTLHCKILFFQKAPWLCRPRVKQMDSGTKIIEKKKLLHSSKFQHSGFEQLLRILRSHLMWWSLI